jgi:hypothetical protein
MHRTYVAKTTVNFPDFELYVRMGDILVYDAANSNSLTVYRGGSIIKTIKTTPLGIAALVKTKMLEEIATKPASVVKVKPVPPVPVPAPPSPSPAPKAHSKPKAASKVSAPTGATGTSPVEETKLVEE